MANARNKYLAKNVVILALGNFGTKFISFFLVPLYTNILSTAEYGTVDLISTLRAILVPLLTFNVVESVVRFSMDKDADHQSIFSFGIAILGMSFILTALIMPIMTMIPTVSEFAGYLYAYTVTLAGSQMMLLCLRGQEKLKLYSLGNVIFSLSVALLNIVFLLGFKWGIQGYFCAYIISNVIAGAFAFFSGKLYRSISFSHFDWELGKRMLNFSVYLIPNSLMWWIMNSSDRMMLTMMCGAEANGIFAISYKIPTLLSSVTMVFTQAWSYSALRAENDADRIAYNNQVFSKVVAFVIMAASFLLLIIRPFLRIYVQNAYYDAWKYVPCLTIGFVFNTVSTFIGTSYHVNKDSKGVFRSAICGAVVNVILNIVLIHSIGIMGAAVATAISYIVVFAYRAIDTQKYLPLRITQKKNIIGLLLVLLMSVSNFANQPWRSLLLISSFIMTLLVFRHDLNDIWSLLVKRFKKGTNKCNC